MSAHYEKQSDLLKALAHPNRLAIIDMLSCGEMCACELLERLHIGQPTLSHHMKILGASDLVTSRKEGKRRHYSLNEDSVKSLKSFIETVTSHTDDCVCKEGEVRCG